MCRWLGPGVQPPWDLVRTIAEETSFPRGLSTPVGDIIMEPPAALGRQELPRIKLMQRKEQPRGSLDKLRWPVRLDAESTPVSTPSPSHEPILSQMLGNQNLNFCHLLPKETLITERLVTFPWFCCQALRLAPRGVKV